MPRKALVLPSMENRRALKQKLASSFEARVRAAAPYMSSHKPALFAVLPRTKVTHEARPGGPLIRPHVTPDPVLNRLIVQRKKK